MKTRKVIVTLEVETNLTVRQLKQQFGEVLGVMQVQVNVVKAPKAAK